MVVEDERALCDAIARSLRNLAYSVDCCYDGQQALDLLDVETFDLVVLDLNLPHVDGMTVLRQLRTTDCETKARLASVGGEVLSLTRKETGILESLMLNQGRPVRQEELIEHVWDSSVNSFSNATRVHISSLRKKLRGALGHDPIRNRIGEGYVMEDGK